MVILSRTLSGCLTWDFGRSCSVVWYSLGKGPLVGSVPNYDLSVCKYGGTLTNSSGLSGSLTFLHAGTVLGGVGGESVGGVDTVPDAVGVRVACSPGVVLPLF